MGQCRCGGACAGLEAVPHPAVENVDVTHLLTDSARGPVPVEGVYHTKYRARAQRICEYLGVGGTVAVAARVGEEEA